MERVDQCRRFMKNGKWGVQSKLTNNILVEAQYEDIRRIVNTNAFLKSTFQSVRFHHAPLKSVNIYFSVYILLCPTEPLQCTFVHIKRSARVKPRASVSIWEFKVFEGPPF